MLVNRIQFVRWAALAFVLALLLSATITSVPDPAELIVDEENWQALPSPRPLPTADTRSRLQALTIWGGEGEQADSQTDEATNRLIAGEDGVLRIVVSWVFKGVVIEGEQRRVLIAENNSAQPLSYQLGDILPGGELVQKIGLDTLLFSLPVEVTEGEQQGGAAAATEFSRQLYAPAGEAAATSTKPKALESAPPRSANEGGS